MKTLDNVRLQIVEEFQRSELSLSAFAKANQIPKSTLWDWTKKLTRKSDA